MDVKKPLDALAKWTLWSKRISYVFVPLFIVSIVAAVYEYATVQDPWKAVAMVLFFCAFFVSAGLAMTMRMQLRKKNQAILAMNERIKSLEEGERKEKRT